MYNPVQTGKTSAADIGTSSSLPPVVWGLPVIGCGLLATMVIGQERSQMFSLEFLGLLCGFWLVCVYWMHRHMSKLSAQHQVSGVSSLVQNIIAGPAAAFIAYQLCLILKRAAGQISDLVADVMPHSLPVAQSAVYLLDHYGAFLAVAIACAAAVSTQMRLGSAVRQFVVNRGGLMERHRCQIAAALVGLALCAPGCLWVLIDHVEVLGPVDAWKGRLVILSYACAFLSFAVLFWFNRKIQSVSQPGRN